jgi:Flp pilus assembly protein TadG
MKTAAVLRAPRRAVTVVELALVLSVFLLFILGICEYGRYIMACQVLDAAVREGARFAVVHTNDATTAEVQDRVDAVLTSAGRHLSNYNKNTSIEVFQSDPATGANIGAWTSAPFGNDITVRVSGTYRPILPMFLLMPQAIAMKAECVMKSEAN